MSKGRMEAFSDGVLAKIWWPERDLNLRRPAFSGATETVLAVTYKDVESCEDPCKDAPE